MMCEYEVIVKYGNGFVVRCQHCGALNIAFGNIALSQHEDEFRSLHDLIRHEFYTHRCNHRHRVREIRINTPLPCFQLLFSFEELHDLHQMLTKAILILDSKKLVN